MLCDLMLSKLFNLNLGAYCSSVAQPLAGHWGKSCVSSRLTFYSLRGEKRLDSLSLAFVTPGKTSLGLGNETLCITTKSQKKKCCLFSNRKGAVPQTVSQYFLKNQTLVWRRHKLVNCQLLEQVD